MLNPVSLVGTTLPDGTPAGVVAVGGKVSIDGVGGDALKSPFIGTVNTRVSLPSGAGLGPDTFVVDLERYSSSGIQLVVLTGAADHSVSIQYSNDGQAANIHPATPETLIANANGSISSQVTKKDRFLHITLSQVGAASTVYAYVTGREVA